MFPSWSFRDVFFSVICYVFFLKLWLHMRSKMWLEQNLRGFSTKLKWVFFESFPQHVVWPLRFFLEIQLPKPKSTSSWKNTQSRMESIDKVLLQNSIFTKFPRFVQGCLPFFSQASAVQLGFWGSRFTSNVGRLVDINLWLPCIGVESKWSRYPRLKGGWWSVFGSGIWRSKMEVLMVGVWEEIVGCQRWMEKERNVERNSDNSDK